MERIAQVLAAVHADIVALQEVVSREGPSFEDHQARYLADQFGYYYALGETRKYRGAAYGNVTLSRWKFVLSRHADLSVYGREERGVLRTDIRLGGSLFHVFNVHLGTGHLERRKQARRLVAPDLLKAIDISGPRVVLGDFNEWTHGLVTRTLKSEFRLTDLRAHLRRSRSYPSGLPLLNLDHMYYDHHFQVEDARFYRSRLSLVASDHLPLVADFVIGAPAD